MSSVIDPQSSSGPKQFVAGRKIGMIHGSQGLLLASLPDCYPYHPNTVHLRRYGWMSRISRELKNPLLSLPVISSEKVGLGMFFGSN